MPDSKGATTDVVIVAQNHFTACAALAWLASCPQDWYKGFASWVMSFVPDGTPGVRCDTDACSVSTPTPKVTVKTHATNAHLIHFLVVIQVKSAPHLEGVAIG